MRKALPVLLLILVGGYLAYDRGWTRPSKPPCARLSDLCKSDGSERGQCEAYMGAHEQAQALFAKCMKTATTCGEAGGCGLAAGASPRGTEPSEVEKSISAPPPRR